nr:MAG TPA: hypothetical protein [Caudoviricetes sp.]
MLHSVQLGAHFNTLFNLFYSDFLTIKYESRRYRFKLRCYSFTSK